MANYLPFLETQQATRQGHIPQIQPVPGREPEMFQSGSGGWLFNTDDWTLFRRGLMMGTTQRHYYLASEQVSQDFIEATERCIDADPVKASIMIVESSYDALKVHASILALVMLSKHPSRLAKEQFFVAFPGVIRTAAHFYEWLAYTRQLRGLGAATHRAAKSWFSQDARQLAYQLRKYPSREGFTARDALRLFKPRPATEAHRALFEYIVCSQAGKDLPEWAVNDLLPSEPALQQIWWVEWLKRHPDQGVKAIKEGRLTHEMVTGVARMDKNVWQALFEDMPAGALLRNLGSLTEIGVLEIGAKANLLRVADKLNNADVIRKAHLHPLAFAIALKVYAAGGHYGKSHKTWPPVAHVCETLEAGLNQAFDCLEPTGKTFYHALDVSNSMGTPISDEVPLSSCEAACIMALASIRSEQFSDIGGFSMQFKPLPINRHTSFWDARQLARDQNFGGTDASAAYRFLGERQIKADVVVFWTDGESWGGPEHVYAALNRYRQNVSPGALAVYVKTSASAGSLNDPKDQGSFEIAGFTPDLPKVIQLIARGDLS